MESSGIWRYHKNGVDVEERQLSCRACLREVICTTISKANKAGLSKIDKIMPTPLCGVDTGPGATRFDICPSEFESCLVWWSFFRVLQDFFESECLLCFIIGWEYVIYVCNANLSALIRWVALLSYAFFVLMFCFIINHERMDPRDYGLKPDTMNPSTSFSFKWSSLKCFMGVK